MGFVRLVIAVSKVRGRKEDCECKVITGRKVPEQLCQAKVDTLRKAVAWARGEACLRIVETSEWMKAMATSRLRAGRLQARSLRMIATPPKLSRCPPTFRFWAWSDVGAGRCQCLRSDCSRHEA